MKPFVMVFALTAIFITITQAQEGMKWGEIPEEYLKMTEYPADTSAAALVLGHNGELRFETDIEYIFQCHKRIKILNQSALDQGNIVIAIAPYERISGIEGRVFSPDGKKYKIEESDIFEEDVDGDWKLYKFTFPNLIAGSVI